MSDYASSSTLGQFKTHEGDYSIEEEIFKIIGGTLKEKEQELRDTIDNQRKEIDRLNNIINEIQDMCREEYYKKNTTDIDSIGLSNNIWVMIYMKIKENNNV